MTDALPDPRPTRRTMLRVLLAGGALAATGTAGYLIAKENGHQPDSSGESPGTETERVLVAVGRLYLSGQPHEASESFLLAALPQLGASIAVDPDAALASLRARVRDDFGAGHVVSVDGWVLARSEARAAGLYALTSARPPQ